MTSRETAIWCAPFSTSMGSRCCQQRGFTTPRPPDRFRAAVEQELQEAGVFVQLLGGIPGRRPAGLPQGYPRLQWELAKGHAESGRSLPILQWCSPSLDIAAIKDEQVMAFLRTHTVRQESLVDFQRSILAALEPPKKGEAQSNNRAIEPDERPKLVCVNVDNSDRLLAEQIQTILRRERIEFISVWFGGSAPENRELLESGLKECDGVIVIYGQAKDSWVDRQLLECRKSRAFRDRPFAALGIFEGRRRTRRERNHLLTSIWTASSSTTAGARRSTPTDRAWFGGLPRPVAAEHSGESRVRQIDAERGDEQLRCRWRSEAVARA